MIPEKRISIDFAGIVFLLAFSFGSFYVFRSGQPQPADFLLLFWVLLCAVTGQTLRFPSAARDHFVPVMVFFLLWTAIVNFTNSLIYQDIAIARRSQFFAFNVLVSVTLYIQLIRKPERYFRLLYLGILIAIVVVAVGVVVNYRPGRLTGWFNNPNQLAFYSILIACMLVAIVEPKRLSSPIVVTGLLMLFLFVFLSLSMSTMAAIPFIIAAIFLRIFSGLRFSNAVIIALGFVFISSILLFTFWEELVFRLENRLETRFGRLESKLDFEGGWRGYGRMFRYPEYMIFGAGEGAVYRFPPSRNELHSTFGVALFNYGILGFITLSYIMYIAVRARLLWMIFLLAAPTVYSITHNGIRTTAFWMLVTILAALSTMHLERSRGGRRSQSRAHASQ